MSPGAIHIRTAAASDLPAIVAMLADDQLGASREDPTLPLSAAYRSAFGAIDADPHNELLVVERGRAEDGAPDIAEEGTTDVARIAGVMQLTFIPSISHHGGWRALIEGVRVHRSARGQGIGEHMIRWAIDRARERGCMMVQLTSNKSRVDARRFYERLGFEATHEGFKLSLPPPMSREA